MVVEALDDMFDFDCIGLVDTAVVGDADSILEAEFDVDWIVNYL